MLLVARTGFNPLATIIDKNQTWYRCGLF